MNAEENLATAVHLRLSIRTTARINFRVRGDRETEFRKLFSSGNEAAQAIYAYCRAHHCTAFVQIYYPKSELWREESVSVDGRSRCQYPKGVHPAGSDETLSSSNQETVTAP